MSKHVHTGTDSRSSSFRFGESDSNIGSSSSSGFSRAETQSYSRASSRYAAKRSGTPKHAAVKKKPAKKSGGKHAKQPAQTSRFGFGSKSSTSAYASSSATPTNNASATPSATPTENFSTAPSSISGSIRRISPGAIPSIGLDPGATASAPQTAPIRSVGSVSGSVSGTSPDFSTNAIPRTDPRTSPTPRLGSQSISRSRSRSKRIIATVGGVFAFVILAAALAVGLYLHALDSRLALGDRDRDVLALLGNTSREPFYALIIGSDTRSEAQYDIDANDSIGGERADVIILARIDAPGKQVSLLSIPRDYPWVDNSGQIRKINDAYLEGAASMVKAVEGISGVDIKHYASIRFATFKQLVDSLGGVEVDVPMEIKYRDPLTGKSIIVSEGHQMLSGEEALLFARARHEYGDNQEKVRQSNVRTLVEAISSQIRKKPVTQLPSLLMDVAEYVGTDMTSFALLGLCMDFKDGMTFYGASAPYQGAIDKAVGGAWLCYDDREGWDKVMSVLESGGDPSTVSYVGDVAYIPGTEETVIIG